MTHAPGPRSAEPSAWASRARLSQCCICGTEGAGVGAMLIAWRDGEPYGWGPRCRDADACHERVMALGDEWLLDDGRPRGSSQGSSQRIVTMPELDFGQAPEVPA